MSRKESIYIILLLILYSISDLIITLSQIGATSFIEGNPLMSWVITNYGKCGLCWIKIMFTTLACIILYFALPRVKYKIANFARISILGAILFWAIDWSIYFVL